VKDDAIPPANTICPMPTDDKSLPKMMLGFVVRRCAAAVGHAPSAQEFAEWANNYRDGERTVFLFGRPISQREAHMILRHPGRSVTARSATPLEQLVADDMPAATNVVSFAAAAARLKRRNGKS
jgi:hypothetical protein